MQGRAILLALLLVLLSACGGQGQPTTAPVSSDGQLTTEAGSPGGESAATPSLESIEMELEIGPGDFYFPDPRAGLAELASYKEVLTISFEGALSGEGRSWSSRSVLVVTREPPARLLTVENTGDLSAADPALLAEADGAEFEIGPDGACRVDRIDPERPLLDWLEPVGGLSGILGAEEAGHEEVDGRAAAHYIFDERAILKAGVAESDGEVWIASDGGQILKYLLTTTGGPDAFGEGAEGRMTWDYQLIDINQPLTLDLPPECLEGLVDAPRLPDAANVLNLRGWLGFDTSSTVAEAAAFYQAELPALGWTLAIEPVPADSIVLEFARGNETLALIIAPSGAATRVDILLETAESLQ